MDKLASNCPRCFGPFQDNDEQDEPNYIICFDGNFQHRRHKAASNESDKRKPKYTPLFMEPAKVDKWAPRSESTNNFHALDPCTAQNTATADHQGGTTWKACDKTGLIDSQKANSKAIEKLDQLLESNPRYTQEYFSAQWTRQQAQQLAAMEDKTLCKLEEHLVELLDYEEKLREAQSDSDRQQALTLPALIVALEEAIASVVVDLGSQEFRNLNQTTSPKAWALIRVCMAKQKLYESKVGILRIKDNGKSMAKVLACSKA
ncbi:hypothetical protein DFH28DRAFT_1126511 [Melampsora americana]|nr:hypothetical protein DFH28DRAFT_1126511 [Melampsora americana]